MGAVGKERVEMSACRQGDPRPGDTSYAALAQRDRKARPERTREPRQFLAVIGVRGLQPQRIEGRGSGIVPGDSVQRKFSAKIGEQPGEGCDPIGAAA